MANQQGVPTLPAALIKPTLPDPPAGDPVEDQADGEQSRGGCYRTEETPDPPRNHPRWGNQGSETELARFRVRPAATGGDPEEENHVRRCGGDP